MTTDLVLDAVEHALFTRAQQDNVSLHGLIAGAQCPNSVPRRGQSSRTR